MFSSVTRLLDRRRRAHSLGCCRCGGPQVRYLYAVPGEATPDDARCQTCGPIPGDAPVVDYGHDRQVTVGTAEADIANARDRQSGAVWHNVDSPYPHVTLSQGLDMRTLLQLIGGRATIDRIMVEDADWSDGHGGCVMHSITSAAILPGQEDADDLLLAIGSGMDVELDRLTDQTEFLTRQRDDLLTQQRALQDDVRELMAAPTVDAFRAALVAAITNAKPQDMGLPQDPGTWLPTDNWLGAVADYIATFTPADGGR